MRIIKNSSGSLTVEASFALSFFLIGFMTVLMAANVVRAQRAVQYGIDRTALEISQYCYVTDKAGMTDKIQASSASLGDIFGQICSLYGSEENDDGEMSGISDMIIGALPGDISDESADGVAAEALCRLLIPKYISENRSSADRYLNSLCRVTLGDINFRHSSVLRDGETVKIVAVYSVDLDPFGILPGKGFSVKLKNSASTRAWIPHGDEDEEEEQEQEEQDEEPVPSIWLIPGNMPRGQAWLKLVKSEHEDQAVKKGKGIDLYDHSSNTAVEVYSMNLFTSSYTVCEDPDSTDPEDYSLKGNAAASKIKSYAAHVLNSCSKLKDSLKMDDGSDIALSGEKPEPGIIVVVPEETVKNQELMDMLALSAGKILADSGVSVTYQYRQRALYTQEEKKQLAEKTAQAENDSENNTEEQK